MTTELNLNAVTLCDGESLPVSLTSCVLCAQLKTLSASLDNSVIALELF